MWPSIVICRISRILQQPFEYFLYHSGYFISAFADYFDFLYGNRLYSLAENHTRHRAVRAGNMHYEFQVDSEDEIGYLAACLNYMASEIARSEDDQKKFVANVSHDFRSPLTSIRGYLEAMKDGTISPDMYDKYLTIVLNETERLTKLTNSLLTLNNLNTKGMLLDRTDFDINQVIRSTAASFEGTCRGKILPSKWFSQGISCM